MTAVPDATVGVTSTLSDANWPNPGGQAWWPWMVRGVRCERTGNIILLIAHHSGYGGRLYTGNGAFTFTEATASFGVTGTAMSLAVGGYLNVDLNHDGYGDLAAFAVESKNLTYDEDTDQLALSFAPWNGEGGIGGSHLNVLREVSGRLEFEDYVYPQWPTTLTYTRKKWTYNGSSYVLTTNNAAGPPSGIPQAVLDEIGPYLDNGTQQSGKRFISVHYVPFDFDLDGSDDDLLILFSGSYGGANRGWFLESDGAGGYIDRTAAWGLPTTGMPVLVRQKEFGRPFEPGGADARLHDLAGAARPDLFLSNIPAQGEFGHYRWNGSTYAKLTTSPITTQLGLDEEYPKRLYAVDLTNSGRLDYVLQRPRAGSTYIYTHDGAGTLTLHSTRTSWDADGLWIDDLNGNGLPDFVLGGDGGADSGITSGTGARCLSIYQNTTTNPGNYLGVLIRRSGGETLNYFGVGSKIEVFTAGQSFALSALIQRWYARPDGLPLVFGLGGEATVDLKVTWPDATTSTQAGVAVNQTITVTG